MARQFCVKCLVIFLIIIGLTVWSFTYLELNPIRFFVFADSNITPFIARFFSPDLSTPYLLKIGSGILETLSISAIATLLASIISIGLALPTAGRFGPTAKSITRFLCNFYDLFQNLFGQLSWF